MLTPAARRQTPTKYVVGMGSGNHFGTICERAATAERGWPAKVAIAPAVNTGPSGRIRTSRGESGSSRLLRYDQRPIAKTIRPNAAGQKTVGGIPACCACLARLPKGWGRTVRRKCQSETAAAEDEAA